MFVLHNLRFERLSTPMRYDRRGESGGGEGVPFLVQRVHDSRRYNSTLSVVQVATLLPKKIPDPLSKSGNRVIESLRLLVTQQRRYVSQKVF
jgi:hypothetical protein